MNELQAVLDLFCSAVGKDQQCAMATVVECYGSTYRRPGARLLITEEGAMAGNVSAGCLESDIREHAYRVLGSGSNVLVEYNTGATAEHSPWELGLGCGGVTRILVEHLPPDALYMTALRRCLETQEAALLCTRVSMASSSPARVQTVRCLERYVADTPAGHLDLPCALPEDIAHKTFSWSAAEPASDTACDERIYFEQLVPPPAVLIFGAGQDVVPVVDMTSMLGWPTVVVDPQARRASLDVFAKAKRVFLARPESFARAICLRGQFMGLVMSHDFETDLAALRYLSASPSTYIGLLGPQQRTARLLERLHASISRFSADRIHGPVGLDIGAETPEEIALSIVAEMQAVVSGRAGTSLRSGWQQ